MKTIVWEKEVVTFILTDVGGSNFTVNLSAAAVIPLVYPLPIKCYCCWGREVI